MVERKRDDLSRAVAAAWSGKGHSIMADSWPGVVVAGEGWRVILSRDACRYRLQQRRQGATKWEPVYVPPSPLEWAARLGGTFPDLPEKAASLPADPKDALPKIAAALAVTVPEARRLRYWAASDYAGVLHTVGNMRSVRDRTGTLYAVQWVKPAVLDAGEPLRWITQHKGPAWPALVELLARKVFDAENPGGTVSEKRARLALLFDGVPERAENGPWPVLKVQARPRPAKR